jgi:hypothetical protein
MAIGEMFYSFHHGGWIFPAEDRMVPKLLRDEHRAPATWVTCPFCGGALPDVASAVERINDEDDGN